ncbi:MAG: twin-arginine translocase TatA/TatE family subunit [Natronomonas sp.]
MMDLLPMQFGLPGGPEVLIILLIAVLLFGANKIPKLARSTGEAMGEFQKGRQEVEEELKEMRDGTTGQSTSSSSTEPATDTETDSDATTDTAEAEADDDEDFEIAEAESDDETETN